MSQTAPAPALNLPKIATRPRARRSGARGKWPVVVLFMPPALVLFTLFVILPMGEAAWYSFFNWNGYGLPDQ